MRLIISRHEATIDYLVEKLVSAEITSHLSSIDDVEHNITEVYGNLPLNLIAELNDRGIKFFAIEFDTFPPRGIELSSTELEKYGISIQEYIVRRVKNE